MSSFRKRNVQRPIPGTRTSPQTGQVITSSGNPSLDVILGGGLPIGSICLIEEDKYVTHSKVLAKYFLAEGVLSKQAIFLGSLDDDPTEMLRKLPKPLNEDEIRHEAALEKENGEDMESNKNGLRIAWRYNDLPMVNSEQTTTKIGHHFNLLEQMDPSVLDFAEMTVWNNTTQQEHNENAEQDDEDDFAAEDDDGGDEQLKSSKDVEMENAKNFAESDQSEAMELDPTSKSEEMALERGGGGSQQSNKKCKIFQNEKYLRILSEISGVLRHVLCHVNCALNNHPKNICRVCITSLASPLWYDEHFPKDILKFLTVLRAAVRSALTVCFITIPMHLVAKYDESLVAKIRNLVDFSIELESFAGSERETNPAFRDYNGLLHIHKIAAINTLSAFMPETSDLAFKLRRKKFVIEKLHLPPELQESSNNADNQTDIVPTLSCGGSSNSAGANPKAPSLDF